MEPTNVAAYFDLAQTYSALNYTHDAIGAYEQLLQVDPCHQDAAVALQRTRLELNPKVISEFNFLYQNGRQNLANMSVADYKLAQQFVLGDANEFVEVGYKQRMLFPTSGRADFGEIPYARWQERFGSNTLLFGEVDLEKYGYGYQTRPTFVAGVELLTTQNAKIRLSGFLNNVYANGEAIRQNIYRTGTQLDVTLRPLRLWEVSGMYRYADYSDQNSLNEFNLQSAHLLLQGREQLRGLATYSFTSFANQTIFGPDPDTLVGTIHPYFAPHAFSFATAGLEWKQWLSCNTFKGANEFWYLFYSGAGVDSNSQVYFLSNGKLLYDASRWVTWSLDAHVIAAGVYHEAGLNGICTVRLP